MNKAATTIGIGMKMFRRGLLVYILALTGLIGGAPALAQLHGDGVLRTGTFNGDGFVSGGKVTVGDLLALGGKVEAAGRIDGDVKRPAGGSKQKRNWAAI